jgi:hypothetical protein
VVIEADLKFYNVTKVACVPTEVKAGHLQNASEKGCCLRELADIFTINYTLLLDQLK